MMVSARGDTMAEEKKLRLEQEIKELQASNLLTAPYIASKLREVGEMLIGYSDRVAKAKFDDEEDEAVLHPADP